MFVTGPHHDRFRAVAARLLGSAPGASVSDGTARRRKDVAHPRRIR
jgi:hypothetical protein